MSTVVDDPVMTPDDLLRLGAEGKGYELVNGRLKELDMSTKSSRVGARIVGRLDRYADEVRPGWVVQSDASFRCFPHDAGRVRRPDAAYTAVGRLTREQYEDEGHCTVAPDLVVEVNSPNDTASGVLVKIQEWLGAGVRVVWEVDPEARLVFAHTGEGVTRFLEADTLTGEPVLPGFAVPVADLFKLPGA